MTGTQWVLFMSCVFVGNLGGHYAFSRWSEAARVRRVRAERAVLIHSVCVASDRVAETLRSITQQADGLAADVTDHIKGSMQVRTWSGTVIKSTPPVEPPAGGDRS